MKLPIWLKISWWGVFVLVLSAMLGFRYPEIAAGNSKPLDVAIFTVWAALMLAPLFAEIDVFGVKLKHEIESLKSEVQHHFSLLGLQIQAIQTNAEASARAEANPQFNIHYPPSEQHWKDVETNILPLIEKKYGLQPVPELVARPEVPNDAAFLMSIRYAIERKVREVWQKNYPAERDQRFPFHVLIRQLMATQAIEPELGRGLIEIYRACSAAIHGDIVSPAQLTFAKEAGPTLLAALEKL